MTVDPGAILGVGGRVVSPLAPTAPEHLANKAYVDAVVGGGGEPVQIVDFPVPSAVWTIDVGALASLVVLDSAGREVWPGEVLYGPGTLVTLSFSAAFSGKVYCFV